MSRGRKCEKCCTTKTMAITGAELIFMFPHCTKVASRNPLFASLSCQWKQFCSPTRKYVLKTFISEKPALCDIAMGKSPILVGNQDVCDQALAPPPDTFSLPPDGKFSFGKKLKLCVLAGYFKQRDKCSLKLHWKGNADECVEYRTFKQSLETIHLFT